MRIHKGLWFTTILAVVIIFHAMTPVVAAQGRCNTYCQGLQTWDEAYTRNIRDLDRVDVKTAGEVYDEMVECWATWMTDSWDIRTGSGYGWAFFKTTDQSRRMFTAIGARNDDTVGMRKVSEDLYVLCVAYGKLGAGVHILRRMASDNVTTDSTGVSDKMIVKWIITDGLQGVDKNTMQVALDRYNYRNAYSQLYARGQIDSLSRRLEKKLELDIAPHDPFSSPDDCHELKEMQIGDEFFTDYDGIQIGNFLVGNWLMVRFAGSRNLHLIYIGKPTAYTSKP